MKLMNRSILAISILFLYKTAVLEAASNSTTNPPAVVDKPGDELSLNKIKLTEKAEQRLGIETAPVVRQPVARYRKYSGEILLPAISANNLSKSGKESQSVQGISAIMNASELVRIAESQIDADGRVNAAAVRLNNARISLKRAEKLVADRAGSQKSLDQARADYAIAAADLQTMKNRRALLGPPALATNTREDLWLRVSVFVNDVEDLDVSAPARLGRLGADLDAAAFQAVPISGAPQFARADASTVDVFYHVSNPNGKFRPNQRVGVEIPLRQKTDGTVVPWSAILHDVHGNSWVYSKIGDRTYARQRVQLLYIQDSLAVLSKGLAAGTPVVVTGAAELFGTEFGVGK